MYHDIIIKSIIGYAASVWCNRMDDIINRAQRQILLQLTNAFRTTPVEALLAPAAPPPMHLQIKQLGTLYYLKKENTEKASEILNAPVNNRHDVMREIINAWQNFWNNNTKARRLYAILPKVAERAKMN